MNASHSLVILSAAVLLLSGCSDTSIEIDGSSDSAFYQSSADLRASLPEPQREYYDLGLVLLKREHDREELDGMTAGEVVHAEIERLEDTLMSRMDKQKKFEGYADEFRSNAKMVPENIARSLEEVGREMDRLRKKIAEARGEGSGE